MEWVNLLFYCTKERYYTYCMKSFYKFLVTQAVFSVKPWVKILQIEKIYYV